jgi:hypothetical protein
MTHTLRLNLPPDISLDEIISLLKQQNVEAEEIKDDWIKICDCKPERDETILVWETGLISDYNGKSTDIPFGHSTLIDEWRDEYIERYGITHWKSTNEPEKP